MSENAVSIGAAVTVLRDALGARQRRILQRPGRASVLVPIVDDGGPLRLLMTRRTSELPTHGGHVAFPGGFMTPGDQDAVATALREASEEIGLPPGRAEILGLLDDFTTRTDLVAVTPVVGRIASLPPLVAAPAEVARIFTIPVEQLLRPERWSERQETGAQGATHRVFVFMHEGEMLWGLSARIVLHLLELTPFGSPVRLSCRE